MNILKCTTHFVVVVRSFCFFFFLWDQLPSDFKHVKKIIENTWVPLCRTTQIGNHIDFMEISVLDGFSI